MFHQCQTALPPSTKIPLFTFQHLFSLNFRLYLFASEVHPLTGVSPCHCNQVRVTGHGLSSLIVKFLIFIFFSQAWELFYDITHFLKQHIFLIVLVTNLVTPITCQHLSISCFDYSQNFQFFFPEISILHFLAIIFGYSTFWLTLHVLPSTSIVIHIFPIVSVYALTWRCLGHNGYLHWNQQSKFKFHLGSLHTDVIGKGMKTISSSPSSAVEKIIGSIGFFSYGELLF